MVPGQNLRFKIYSSMLTINNKGGHQLIIENYKFNQKRVNTNSITWCCSIKNCPAKAKTNILESEFISSFKLICSFHNHTSIINESLKKELLEKMKALIINSDKPPRWVVNTILRGRNTETISLFPNIESLYKQLRNFKNRKINPKPYKYHTLNLSESLSETYTFKKFYQYGLNNFGTLNQHDDLLIFYNEESVSKLYSEDVWCVDGTFSVVPKPFKQLYIISFIKNGVVFPVIFGILKNIIENTYYRFFEVIKSLNGTGFPKFIKTDFEKASINALIKNFPEAKISGCQFHLGQAIQRKIKELGLMNDYKYTASVKLFAKALMSLSYVKPSCVFGLFNQLKS